MGPGVSTAVPVEMPSERATCVGGGETAEASGAGGKMTGMAGTVLEASGAGGETAGAGGETAELAATMPAVALHMGRLVAL
jgi:hypothetical protein